MALEVEGDPFLAMLPCCKRVLLGAIHGAFRILKFVHQHLQLCLVVWLRKVGMLLDAELLEDIVPVC